MQDMKFAIYIFDIKTLFNKINAVKTKITIMSKLDIFIMTQEILIRGK